MEFNVCIPKDGGGAQPPPGKNAVACVQILWKICYIRGRVGGVGGVSWEG